MKIKLIKSSIVGAVIMWGASWIGFLVSFIPLYIFRGVYHDMATKERLEDVIMTAFGMLGAVVFLLIYYSRNEDAEKTEIKESAIRAALSSAIYGIVWIITGCNYLVGAYGFHLATLFGENQEYKPVFTGVIISAIICMLLYTGASILGSAIARKRKIKSGKQIRGEI
ncbi:MAG: hypothetical protein IJD70_00610 [Clostridia bacterium]|nr:hypothetical protein [Clostridia bacterium]